MAWRKKYPGLASMVGSHASQGPTVAPVGESQPAMATHAMAQDLKPQEVPSEMPIAPKLAAQPDMHEETKKRALKNIAMGRKGF